MTVFLFITTSIIILELNQQAMNETRQSIQKQYPHVQVILEQVDFSQPPSSWIPRISALIEHKDIAVLVNNVGINTEIPSLSSVSFLIFPYQTYSSCVYESQS